MGASHKLVLSFLNLALAIEVPVRTILEDLAKTQALTRPGSWPWGHRTELLEEEFYVTAPI